MKTVHYHKKQPNFYRNKPVIFPAVATLLLALSENPVNAEEHLQSSTRSAQANSGKAIQVADNANTNQAGKPGKKSSARFGSDITTLEPMTVTAKDGYDAKDPYNEDYVLPNATSGTKTDTPIMETPLNVQVISKQVLKDQQVITLDQALKNVSGVTLSRTFLGANSTFLRGFETKSIFRNGVRFDNNTGFGNAQQFANVESVEVLKGPAAILFGRVEPGGNFVWAG